MHRLTDVPAKELFNNFRVTMSAVLIVKRKGVVLVHYSEAAQDQWVLPQGAIEIGESFEEAFFRECDQEFPGLVPRQGPYLGDLHNILPPDRGGVPKYIVAFGGVLACRPEQINRKRIGAVRTVFSAGEFEGALHAVRRDKADFIRRVVATAVEIGLLDWPVRSRIAA